MARRKASQFTKTAGVIFSGLVALSMILSLLGPMLFRASRSATPTPAPTWTPWPTYTPTAEPEVTGTPPLPTAAPPPPLEETLSGSGCASLVAGAGTVGFSGPRAGGFPV